MNAEEFYKHVSRWSQCRRKYESYMKLGTELRFKMINGKATEDDEVRLEETKSMSKKFETAYLNEMYVIDSEVDRVDAIIAKRDKQ